MKINILYSLDVERSPAVSDDDRKIKAALDSLFKPLNPDILNYLHYSNSDLKLSAITALLQNDPVLKAGMEKLSSGGATWEELVALKGTKLNDTVVWLLIHQASIDSKMSISAYLNTVFGTHVTPETTISINGGTMSIKDAVAYNFEKGKLKTDTKENLGKLKK